MLPAPASNLAEIVTNTSKSLWITIYKTTEKQFADYIERAKEQGFSKDENENSLGYSSYNEQGYKLKIHRSKRDQSITLFLDTPEPTGKLIWPSNPLAQLLPVPSSTEGVVTMDETNSLHLEVAQTSLPDLNKYVDACIQHGFDQDFSRSEKWYSASNSDAYKLEVSYSGYQRMSIYLTAP